MEDITAVRMNHTAKERIMQYLQPEPYTLNEYIEYLDHESLKDDKRSLLLILAAWGAVLGFQLILYFSIF